MAYELFAKIVPTLHNFKCGLFSHKNREFLLVIVRNCPRITALITRSATKRNQYISFDIAYVGSVEKVSAQALASMIYDFENCCFRESVPKLAYYDVETSVASSNVATSVEMNGYISGTGEPTYRFMTNDIEKSPLSPSTKAALYRDGSLTFEELIYSIRGHLANQGIFKIRGLGPYSRYDLALYLIRNNVDITCDEEDNIIDINADYLD